MHFDHPNNCRAGVVIILPPEILGFHEWHLCNFSVSILLPDLDYDLGPAFVKP